MELAKLREPFSMRDIEWRVGRSGVDKNEKVWALVFAYVTARAVQDRFDEVCGPENWKVSYEFVPGGAMATISIFNPETKEWTSKQDGSDPSKEDPFKGVISSALKRAGSAWGVGRYLYKHEAMFAEVSMDKRNASDGFIFATHKEKNSDRKINYWYRPPEELPELQTGPIAPKYKNPRTQPVEKKLMEPNKPVENFAPKKSDKISEAQAKRFYAISKANNVPDFVVKELLHDFSCDRIDDLSWKHYNHAVEFLEKYKSIGTPPPSSEFGEELFPDATP